MYGIIRLLVTAAVILILAYLAVTHDYDLGVGPGIRLEHSSSR